MKANGFTPEGFTAVWAERTALYLSDIETLPAKTWKKIMSAARNVVDEKKKASKPASTLTAKAPRRRQIIDADESD